MRARVALALLACAAASAAAAGTAGGAGVAPFVPAALAAQARAHPGAAVHVIVVGRPGVSSSAVAAAVPGTTRRFSSIDGVAATIDGAALLHLAGNPHFAEIVPDAPVLTSGLDESGLWRPATQADQVAASLGGATPPAIAVVDSGVDTTKAADFGARVVASVNLESSDPSAVGDGEGHGTMVAGIAAGGADAYPGVAAAPIVSLRTADATGASQTSDVIAACDWILQHQADYDIRVANFSMVSDAETSFTNDPLDAAVEQLWFHGIVVVTAVGNYGQPGGVRVAHAPGNDPFVLSVGALDTSGTVDPSDDVAAPWSAYGYTGDGFAKPEISAPGRWIVAPVPETSTLATTAPDRVVEPGYMWMSGTSLAAPMAAGAAAAILALHPDWTPDQVKGALMVSASALPAIPDWGGGVGELAVGRALAVAAPPNPNAGLDSFVVDNGSGPTFDSASWQQAVQSSSEWSASEWSASEWSASEWSASEWSASEWSASEWSASEWSASEWSASEWSAGTSLDSLSG